MVYVQNQNPSETIRQRKFSVIVRYKQIPKSRQKPGPIDNYKKRTSNIDFTVTMNHRMKIKGSEKSDKYLDLAREQKKTGEHESDDESNCYWYTWNDVDWKSWNSEKESGPSRLQH